jgi:hypothetical protein
MSTNSAKKETAQAAPRPESGCLDLPNGEAYQFKLRRRYGTLEPIGIRISRKAGPRVKEVDQYDLRGTLSESARRQAEAALLEAYDYLFKPAALCVALGLLKDMAQAGLCDHCHFEPVG